ncbi:hypothetical protein HYH03_000069 [Edaphochlamys debaryana]|uniref:Uncharacterized protein n=1 Tax=Edaphochlamys debaryana TaxID=47281 RepID=A0A835YGW0_9CHLO|nr:hypothetical protein HYH03_000069 [Edaphochlamys debaryana]|eukprot:KAG2501562.1 hypothetical protein HYH03_000069 [Edaphochlamys debaryana]
MRATCWLLSALLLLLWAAPVASRPRPPKPPRPRRAAPRPPGWRNVTAEELSLLGQVPSVGDQKPNVFQDPNVKLTDDDLVFATGSCRARMNLVKAQRSWRKGVRSFVLTDHNETDLLRLNTDGAGHRESYAYFPDDGDVKHLGANTHGKKRGDTRAAAAPFAAHRHFGESYKWMMYGDDDTLFYINAVKRMLSEYDHNLPLAFSDNLWYGGYHPNPHAPRCLPCRMAEQPERVPTLEQVFRGSHMRDYIRRYNTARNMPAGEDVLEAAAASPYMQAGSRFVPRPACPYCTPEHACPPNGTLDPNITWPEPCKTAGAHGGAGMIFSVGLLRKIGLTAALACIQSHKGAPGGDFMVSNCLWQHGIAFTDPGPLTLSLYDGHRHVFGGNKGMGYLWDPVGMLTHGRCNDSCKWMLRNTLSLHIKGRHFRTWRISAAYMLGVALASDAAHTFLDLTSRDLGESWRLLPYGSDPATAPGEEDESGRDDDLSGSQTKTGGSTDTTISSNADATNNDADTIDADSNDYGGDNSTSSAATVDSSADAISTSADNSTSSVGTVDSSADAISTSANNSTSSGSSNTSTDTSSSASGSDDPSSASAAIIAAFTAAGQQLRRSARALLVSYRRQKSSPRKALVDTPCLLAILLLLTGLGDQPRPAAAKRDTTRDVTAKELDAFGVVPSPRPQTELGGETGADPKRKHSHQAASAADEEEAGAGSGWAKGPGKEASDENEEHGDKEEEEEEEAPGGLTDQDFLFVAGTCGKRRSLVRSQRSWRGRRVRSFYLADNAHALAALNENDHNEVYAYFPSDGSEELGGRFRGGKSGDTRAAVAPFAAHRHFKGTYKWLLYGDDDTIFFMDAVKRMLASLDPDQPLALSDSLWYNSIHPNPHAPRCLPCDMREEDLPPLLDILEARNMEAGRMHYARLGKLPSEEELLGWTHEAAMLAGVRYRPDPSCPVCTPAAACAPISKEPSVLTSGACNLSVPHGGAGMILSAGLMRSIPYHSFLNCLLAIQSSSGSDRMFTECLWQHDVAITDPGASVRHLYDPRYVLFGGKGARLLEGPIHDAERGRCDEACAWQLENTVSLHAYARQWRDQKDLASKLQALPGERAQALAALRALRRRSTARRELRDEGEEGIDEQQGGATQRP